MRSAAEFHSVTRNRVSQPITPVGDWATTECSIWRDSRRSSSARFSRVMSRTRWMKVRRAPCPHWRLVTPTRRARPSRSMRLASQAAQPCVSTRRSRAVRSASGPPASSVDSRRPLSADGSAPHKVANAWLTNSRRPAASVTQKPSGAPAIASSSSSEVGCQRSMVSPVTVRCCWWRWRSPDQPVPRFRHGSPRAAGPPPRPRQKRRPTVPVRSRPRNVTPGTSCRARSSALPSSRPANQPRAEVQSARRSSAAWWRKTSGPSSCDR